MSILIANRLLPQTLLSGWPPRDSLERWLFWSGWALAMLHAFARSAPVALGRINPAWREQCWAVAVMATAAVLLNWTTTGDHLLRTIGTGYWPVAGVDLSLPATAALAVLAARQVRQRETGCTGIKVDRPRSQVVVREPANV